MSCDFKVLLLTMAEVLDSVLNGETLLKDLREWLIADNSKVLKHKDLNDKSEFVPYFLNYIKENCAWLLSDNECTNSNSQATGKEKRKSPAYSTNQEQVVKKSPSNSGGSKTFKKYNNHDSTVTVKDCNIEIKSIGSKVSPNVLQQVNASNDLLVHNKGGNFMDRQSFNSHKNVQTINMGCMPYATKRKDFKTKVREQNASFGSHQRQSLNIPDISSFDAFPPVSSKNDALKSHRRITPTPVQIVNPDAKQFSSSFFSVPDKKVPDDVFKTSPLHESTNSNLQHEREMLKKNREDILKMPGCTYETKSVIYNGSTVQSDGISIQYVIPDPNLICSIEKMLIFIDIYDCLLNNGLVPNITAELYFMFQLLTSKIQTHVEKQLNDNNLFHSVHNCVYFAISILRKQDDLLRLLDNSTLITLAEIPYLSKFSPELIDFIKSCSTGMQEKKTKLSALNCVPYQVENDNRNNFPDDSSFHSFKKQRDLFYELLRDWQQQHLTIDTRFQDKFVRKVRQLISLGSNSINFYHLARLIQSQLIASCLCLEVNEVYDELLSDIKRNFPDKFQKLQERFLTPSHIGAPSPTPGFYGIQSFFFELIEAAASAILNQHLINLLVAEILDLNHSNICDGEISSTEVKEKFTFILHTLRLLAKFLGYLQFLPYKIQEPIPSGLLNSQVKVRENIPPSLDIVGLLQDAINKNYLILAVPWTVEYLSMMDAIAPYLKHNQQILKILVEVYRGKYSLLMEKNSFLFLRLVIGWLFDVQYLPFKFDVLLQPVSLQKKSQTILKHLDHIQVIDKQLIYSCCPYLVEFKILIDEFLSGIRNKNREIRKITPFSTSITSSAPLVHQQIESNLEENFFSLHPYSVKKTVEFVSERIASKAINKIRIEVTNMKLSLVKTIANDVAYKSIFISAMSTLQKRKQISSIVDANTLNLNKEVKEKAYDFAQNICCQEIEQYSDKY